MGSQCKVIMLYTDLLLAYGCLFNTNWCKPHKLIEGSFKNDSKQLDQPCTPEGGVVTLLPSCPDGYICGANGKCVKIDEVSTTPGPEITPSPPDTSTPEPPTTKKSTTTRRPITTTTDEITTTKVVLPSKPPTMKLEFCIMPSMMTRSRPAFGMGFDIKIVQCLPGESCVPANSKIFGNALGLCHNPNAPRDANVPISKHRPGYPNPYQNRPKPVPLPAWGYGRPGGYAEGRY